MLDTRIPAVVLLSSLLAIATPASAQSIELPEDVQLELEVVDVEEAAPLDDPTEPPGDQAVDDDTGARVMGELGASLATIAGGGLVGGLLGAAVARPCSSDPDSFDLCFSPMLEILLGMMVGGIVGAALTPLSVDAAGDSMGGEGGLGGAWLGWLVGVGSGAMTVGIGLTALATLDSQPGSIVLIVSSAIAGVMLLIGPLVGYELSHGRTRRRSPITITPTLGYDGRSGTVGATGRF